ncbi:PIR Superfamily Protein [Plasmodium ovale curtisi]|uniref:PIR Superfamily Protein n=1 Tax=Plasmodium ovale curtisi TaxID=864141 RepID=A0A1A8WND4_PLAOA|nr:PIR Superfamily Protein [Plasmodium ovale curtisi]SBT01808.1 PIR Superfamily Protein [Plasmodium ovale curtisi]
MGHDEGEDFYCFYTEFTNYKDKSKSIKPTEINEYTKSCAQVINDKFQDKTNIEEVLTKIKKFLKYYKNSDSQNSNKYYGYINYWLKTQLTGNDPLIKNTTDFYNMFKNCDSDVELLNKKFLYINSKQNDLFKRINELYSVYDDYYIFISYKSSMSSKNFESIKCVYAEQCVKKYNNIVDNYASNDKSNLLYELQNLKHLFNQNGIFSLQGCEKEIPTLKPLPEENKSEIISSLSSSSLIPIPAIAATVGIFPLLLLLYKHTPLVSLLYNRIIGTKNKLINVAPENHELSYFDERNNVFADNESYNLIYSSADYS